MDREEMLRMLRSMPVEVTMNDGSHWVVDEAAQPICSDISLLFLKKDDDGKWRHVNLPLVTISSVVSEAPTA